MSFCTKGLPEVAESTASKSEGKPSLWEGGTRVMADEGVAKKESSQNLTQRLKRSPLFQRSKVILGMMDSATSPSTPRRMTALVEILEH